MPSGLSIPDESFLIINEEGLPTISENCDRERTYPVVELKIQNFLGSRTPYPDNTTLFVYAFVSGVFSSLVLEASRGNRWCRERAYLQKRNR